MKKKVIAMLLTMTMVCGLAACGGSNQKDNSGDSSQSGTEGSGTEDNSTEEPGGSEASGETVKLRFLTYETAADATQQAVEAFTKENPNISVEVVAAADFTAMNTNAIAAHQANDDYDVMLVNHVDTLAYVQGGIISSLQEYIDKDGIDYTQIIFASLLDQGKSGGEFYALPVNTGTRVMAFNKDLFDQYNLEIPTTQEEMLAAAEALTVDGNFGYVSPLCENAYSPTYEQGMYLASNGGRLFTVGEDGKAVATIDTPEMREFLNFMLGILPYMPKDSLTMTGDDARKAFASGNIGMYKYGNWEMVQMPETEFEVVLTLVPEGSAGRISTGGGFQLGMGGGSKHPEEAWELIKYLTTVPEANVLLTGGDMPTMDAAYEIAPYNDTKYDIFNEQLNNAILTVVPVPNLNAVSEKFFSYWSDLLYGKITVDELCEQAQASVQELLDENYK